MNSSAVRLQKAMADAGLASRREAENLIRQGLVRVNGQVVTEMGVKVMPGQDRLEISGQTVRLTPPTVREVWAFYKPKRCVSTLSDPQGRPTIKDYFPPTRQRLVPVGRLDYDAEGLMLLTSDGEFAQRVAHPSHGVHKVYLVKVKGLVDPAALARQAQEPVLDGKRRQEIQARILHTINQKTWMEVVLREGIKHHIKKFFMTMGHRVEKIKRFQVGPVGLDDLQPGQSRKLTAEEISRFDRPHAPKQLSKKALAESRRD
ncbi:MAG: rRNA pseudouridine synthase [Deltaproteobacteria bacterium]|nr:rRNA pseudouridine synthase [Deltaproteobacteria bacterium]